MSTKQYRPWNPDQLVLFPAAMRAKLNTERGREIYARRKVIVEPVFGHTKEARNFRRFSLRGQRKVAAEWTIVSLCSNLLKLVNHRLAEQLTGMPTRKTSEAT